MYPQRLELDQSQTQTTALHPYTRISFITRSILSSDDREITHFSHSINIRKHITEIDQHEPATQQQTRIQENMDTSFPQSTHSIPFPPCHVHRTYSEIRLCEAEEVADYKDYSMCMRLVDGIVNQTNNMEVLQKRAITMVALPPQNQGTTEIISNIIRTRLTPCEDTSCRSQACYRKERGDRSCSSHANLEETATLLSGPQFAKSGFAISFHEDNVFTDEDDGIFEMDL